MPSCSFIEEQRLILEAKLARYRAIDPSGRDPAWIRQKRVIAIPHLVAALAAIKNGSYGMCQSCEEEIPIARLKAVPGATRCIACQRELDRHGQ